MRFTGDKVRHKPAGARHDIGKTRRQQIDTEAGVVDHQTDRALIDAVEQAIMIRIDTVAIWTTNTGEARQVCTTQRDHVDTKTERLTSDIAAANFGTDVVGGFLQTTQIDVDRGGIAFTECQRSAQA